MKNRLNIMIAEDEQRARRGLRNLIESISDDFQVVAEAADGYQALDMMKTAKPDIVFTDIRMPYMDGIELIRMAKKENISAQFVIVSAYEEFETARQAISLGVKEYIVKPITYDEVETVLKKISEGGSTRRNKLKEQYPSAHPLVKKSLNYIEKEYMNKINQKELAEILGISQEYFCVLFNKDIGESFSKFIRNYRIDIAKELLIQNEQPRDEVAYKVGFSDVKYFNKVFKDVTGESVSDFLRK